MRDVVYGFIHFSSVKSFRTSTPQSVWTAHLLRGRMYVKAPRSTVFPPSPPKGHELLQRQVPVMPEFIIFFFACVRIVLASLLGCSIVGFFSGETLWRQQVAHFGSLAGILFICFPLREERVFPSICKLVCPFSVTRCHRA